MVLSLILYVSYFSEYVGTYAHDTDIHTDGKLLFIMQEVYWIEEPIIEQHLLCTEADNIKTK